MSTNPRLLDTYRPASGYDELIGDDGRWRPVWDLVAAALPGDPGSLAMAAQRAARILDAEGSGHLVNTEVLDDAASASRPWRLDPMPFVVDGTEFQKLAAGVAQRIRLLEHVLADHYGPGTLVSSGALPLGVFGGSPASRSAAHGAAPRRWIVHASVDLVRTAVGEWRVAGHDVQAPGGLGYAQLNRSAMARVAPDALRRCGVVPVHPHLDSLRRALTAHAPLGVRSPRCVVLTGGPSHPRYVEHSWLATHLGYHLVEGGDVVMRAGRLWLRALDGLEPLDVVLRGLDDGSLDPLEVVAPADFAGVPGLVWGERRGAVAVANAFGAGLAEIPEVSAALPAVAAQALGESLLLDDLDPRDTLATVPVFDGEVLSAGSVCLRMFAVVGNDGVSVMPGGAARVLSPGDHPRRPTSLLAKDVWVVGAAPTAPTLALRAYRPPQVDLSSSVPRRAADALYQLGRAAERTEVLVRALRTVTDRVASDPTVVQQPGEGWAHGAVALLRAACLGDVFAPLPADHGAVLDDEIRHTLDSIARSATDLLVEARSVREFLSTTTGRLLGRISAAITQLHDPDWSLLGDQLDILLVDLAALAGLAVESTVRGPAWRFLDLGRRLERGIAVCGAVEATLGLVVDDAAFQPLTEVLLAANESLVAYRRRYRSDVEVGAVLELLLLDDTNPRSLAFQVDRLREHAASLVWPEGTKLAEQVGRALMVPVSDDIVNDRRWGIDRLVVEARGPLLALGDAVHERWFADPVQPVAVRGR